MKITKDMLIADVLKANEALAEVFWILKKWVEKSSLMMFKASGTVLCSFKN